MRAALLLASASPRRRFLLRLLGVPFAVRVAGVSERRRPGEAPRALVRRLARAKAAAVARRRPSDWVLGADTLVALGNRILGRPRDRRQAEAMLRSISGRVHRVWTGVALLGPGGSGASRFEACTRVRVAPLREGEIRAYLDSREWRGKAGAYAIQGRFAAHIRRLEGEYTNVVGLPLEPLRRLLRRAGLLPAGRAPGAQPASGRQRRRGRRAAATSSKRRTGV